MLCQMAQVVEVHDLTQVSYRKHSALEAKYHLLMLRLQSGDSVQDKRSRKCSLMRSSRCGEEREGKNQTDGPD